MLAFNWPRIYMSGKFRLKAGYVILNSNLHTIVAAAQREIGYGP